ncbi:unnamed protein product [Owenia fusiformis]|uniref:TIR domain-containing protein n=1 Tax=Owenia fusiformis TaxID=6347 RepID=A0A8S4Q5T1_OWEFU|nr:unnamed protein product [Owenia fusiformis]
MYKKYSKKAEASPTSSTSSSRAQEAKDEKETTEIAADNVEKSSDSRKTSLASQQYSIGPKDLMISYSHADKEMMHRLKTGLEENGITVWVDTIGLKAGVDFLSKIGQAIIDAKLFISLVSAKTVESKYCKDELALAYVSNKAIFPVGLQTPDELFPLMDTGMKLQLVRFDWTLILDSNSFDEQFPKLLQKLKKQLAEINGEITAEKEKKSKDDSSEKAVPDASKTLQKRNSRKNLYTRSMSREKTGIDLTKSDTSAPKVPSHEEDFWEANFLGLTEVEWKKFEDAYTKTYSKEIAMLYSGEFQEWLKGIIQRELDAVEDHIVTYEKYTDFCTINGKVETFWSRVMDQAVESYTIREVFDMDSSVRVEAIENLGKFDSPQVVEALKDLLSDQDNNVRAVAAISLAKTGPKSPHIVKCLMKCLNDKDRLVRESGCIALGHMKVEKAVNKLVQLWRNDYISSVRDAAAVALELIGGEEANKAMHITKVLAEEIRLLTQDD